MDKINIKDKIYGNFSINEPVVIELIESDAFQRLRKVSQFGIPDELYHIKGFFRYEHSIGVYFLLKKLGASLEEQIAGLLHDVSHSAFSHVIDWVFGNEVKETYQDDVHSEFIKNSVIPKILSKYLYDWEKIADIHKFKLMDRDIPDLCADRIDYSLRELKDNVTDIINSLFVVDSYIAFNNLDIAVLFSNNFLKTQMEHWGGFEAVVRYKLFSEALKKAIKLGILRKQDFWENGEDRILNILKNSGDEEIDNIVNLLRNKSLMNLKCDDGDGIVLHKKFRYVDPLVSYKGGLKKLSEINKKFAKYVNKMKIENKKGFCVKNLDTFRV